MKEKWPLRETLYPENRGEPIARLLKDLRRHEYKPPPPVDPESSLGWEDTESDKRELYALTAFIIEQVHSELREKISAEKNYYTYDLTDPAVDAIRKRTPLPTPEKIGAMNPEDLFSSMQNVRSVYPSMFLDKFQNWKKDLEEDSHSYNTQVWHRLCEILPHYADDSIQRPTRLRDPVVFLMAGANTAAYTSWDIIRAIPVIFYQTQGYTITPEEFRTLMNNSESSVIQLASLHIDSFGNLSSFVSEKTRLPHTCLGLEFPIEFFELKKNIADDPSRWQLDFSKETLGAYRNWKTAKWFFEYPIHSSEEDRFGCPARDARIETGGKKQSVVSSIYEIHKNLSEQYITPHLEKYTEGALKIATEPD